VDARKGIGVNTLAVDIGGSKVAMAAFAGDRIVKSWRTATDRAGGKDWMLGEIERVAQLWQAEMKLNRCGVGFGGPVNFTTQSVACSVHVEGWSGFPLGPYLKDRLELPVVVDNDANVGALGESRLGAGVDCASLLYITISTGIGGGIILDRQLYRGTDGCAGEIGHVCVRPDGPPCLCGARGCVERVCCGLWLERDHGRDARELFQDPQFVAHYVVDLARGITAALMLLNPQRVVIGGGISRAGEALFAPLRQELSRQLPQHCHCSIDCVPAALGDQSVLYGAMVLAREQSP
jgi:glucokinase